MSVVSESLRADLVTTRKLLASLNLFPEINS